MNDPTVVRRDCFKPNCATTLFNQCDSAQFSKPTGRLVYGGHTIGLALAQLTRTMPNILTVADWHSCDHLGSVREGDTTN